MAIAAQKRGNERGEQDAEDQLVTQPQGRRENALHPGPRRAG